MKTELTNQEKMLQVADKLLSIVDTGKYRGYKTYDDLIAEYNQLKKEVEFDLLCDPDIYEANANDHFIEEMRDLFKDNELPASGLD